MYHSFCYYCSGNMMIVQARIEPTVTARLRSVCILRKNWNKGTILGKDYKKNDKKPQSAGHEKARSAVQFSEFVVLVFSLIKCENSICASFKHHFLYMFINSVYSGQLGLRSLRVRLPCIESEPCHVWSKAMISGTEWNNSKISSWAICSVLTV